MVVPAPGTYHFMQRERRAAACTCRPNAKENLWMNIFTGKIRCTAVAAALALLTAALLAVNCGSDRGEPVGITIQQDVRVVYQVKTDEWREGVGSGLYQVRNLYRIYDDMGLRLRYIHLSAVFHGDAAYWMLTDEAYNEHRGVSTGNPNRELIEELADDLGASIEVCSRSLKQHGWSEDDVLPEVTIVRAAYPRIIDLQLQGYAYIRF